MRRDARFPADQAEIVVTDVFVEQLGAFPSDQPEEVLAEVVRLCSAPGGTHSLHKPLRGWNTLEVLRRQHRVIYKATEEGGTGLIEVLCLGPRSDSEVYDMAKGLVDAGLLDPDMATALWDALAILDVLEEDVGLDGWDYRPPPAPEGLIKAVVAAGVLEEDVAVLLSKEELLAALDAWEGRDDPRDVLIAALEAARRRARRVGDPTQILQARAEGRCGVLMPRARVHCIRRKGHPGPHRGR